MNITRDEKHFVVKSESVDFGSKCSQLRKYAEHETPIGWKLKNKYYAFCTFKSVHVKIPFWVNESLGGLDMK